MPKRIPHQKEMEVITGSEKTRDYLAMQKMFGRFYFKDFFTRLDLLSKTGRYLEVGPGPGYQTALVAERYRPEEIVALEYSPDMVRVAQGHLKGRGLEGIRFIHGAVEDTSLLKRLGQFDLIYSTFSLHHWSNAALGIKNLYESLTDKGALFIYDFVRGGVFYYLKIKRGVWESLRASYTPKRSTAC